MQVATRLILQQNSHHWAIEALNDIEQHKIDPLTSKKYATSRQKVACLKYCNTIAAKLVFRIIKV
jgi:hypothetical protein